MSKYSDQLNGSCLYCDGVFQHIPTIQYFEDVFPQMQNVDFDGESATDAIYNGEWAPQRYNYGETGAIYDIDFGCFYGGYCEDGTSKFWQSLFKILGVEIKLSSAYHPQTDGQTKSVNQVLEQYLRCTINYHQDNWVELLPLAEFAYNNTLQGSTQQTPFFANYGHHPRFDQFNLNISENPAATDLATRLSDI